MKMEDVFYYESLSFDDFKNNTNTTSINIVIDEYTKLLNNSRKVTKKDSEVDFLKVNDIFYTSAHDVKITELFVEDNSFKLNGNATSYCDQEMYNQNISFNNISGLEIKEFKYESFKLVEEKEISLPELNFKDLFFREIVFDKNSKLEKEVYLIFISVEEDDYYFDKQVRNISIIKFNYLSIDSKFEKIANNNENLFRKKLI